MWSSGTPEHPNLKTLQAIMHRQKKVWFQTSSWGLLGLKDAIYSYPPSPPDGEGVKVRSPRHGMPLPHRAMRHIVSAQVYLKARKAKCRHQLFLEAGGRVHASSNKSIWSVCAVYYYCMKLKGPEIPFMLAVFCVDPQGRRKESPHDQQTCLRCRLFCVVNIHVNCTCLKYWCS